MDSLSSFTSAASAPPPRDCPGYERHLESNWNGNVSFGNANIQIPSSVEELQRIVRDATSLPVRVVGRGHSFTPLALGGTILSLHKLNRILEYQPPTDQSLGSITIEGGTTYSEVIQCLSASKSRRGAIPNLPSCPQFTVAGAIATATHGSGIALHNLSSHVSMLEFVQADGTLVRYQRSDNNYILEGCRVHLGCLGVISQLTLDVVPYFDVQAVRYDNIPLNIMIDNLPDWWTRCDSLSVWTSGFGKGVGKGTCWATFRQFIVDGNTDTTTAHEDTLPSFLTKHELGETGHLCNRMVPRYCTDPNQPEHFNPTGRGPWYDYLTVTMHQGRETSMQTTDLQAEFFVPLEHAQEAIRAVWNAVTEWKFSPPWGYQPENSNEDSNSDLLQRGMVDAMEFRQVKGGDGAWLSPHNAGDCLGIHISFNGDPALRTIIQTKYVPVIEKALRPFGAKPHWGKLASNNTYDHATMQRLYPALEQFQHLCYKHDPKGKFRNDFVSRALFPPNPSLQASKL